MTQLGTKRGSVSRPWKKGPLGPEYWALEPLSTHQAGLTAKRPWSCNFSDELGTMTESVSRPRKEGPLGPGYWALEPLPTHQAGLWCVPVSRPGKNNDQGPQWWAVETLPASRPGKKGTQGPQFWALAPLPTHLAGQIARCKWNYQLVGHSKKNRVPVVCGSEQAREEECSGPPMLGPGNTAGKCGRPDGMMPVELDPP